MRRATRPYEEDNMRQPSFDELRAAGRTLAATLRELLDPDKQALLDLDKLSPGFLVALVGKRGHFASVAGAMDQASLTQSERCELAAKAESLRQVDKMIADMSRKRSRLRVKSVDEMVASPRKRSRPRVVN
jgi:hypothetical protein